MSAPNMQAFKLFHLSDALQILQLRMVMYALKLQSFKIMYLLIITTMFLYAVTCAPLTCILMGFMLCFDNTVKLLSLR